MNKVMECMADAIEQISEPEGFDELMEAAFEYMELSEEYSKLFIKIFMEIGLCMVDLSTEKLQSKKGLEVVLMSIGAYEMSKKIKENYPRKEGN